MKNGFPSVCSACGQTMPPAPSDAPIHLGPVGSNLYARVQRAGPHGVRSDVLFDYLYGMDPNGGPLHGIKSMHSMICNVNKRLAKAGQRIVGQGQMKGVKSYYRLVSK